MVDTTKTLLPSSQSTEEGSRATGFFSLAVAAAATPYCRQHRATTSKLIPSPPEAAKRTSICGQATASFPSLSLSVFITSNSSSLFLVSNSSTTCVDQHLLPHHPSLLPPFLLLSLEVPVADAVILLGRQHRSISIAGSPLVIITTWNL